MSCSPYRGSPSNSSGMLNGTGESISTSSINWVCFLMFELFNGSRVTKPNKAFSFPSLIISPTTICVPDNSITPISYMVRSIKPLM